MIVTKVNQNAIVVIDGKWLILPTWMVKRENELKTSGKVLWSLYWRTKRSGRNRRTYNVACMPGFSCNLHCTYCYQWNYEGGEIRKPSIQKNNLAQRKSQNIY